MTAALPPNSTTRAARTAIAASDETMTVLITVETVLLLLLTLMVIGLLRSHAEILSRLDTPSPQHQRAELPDESEARSLGEARDIEGVDLRGNEQAVRVKGVPYDTLVAFLSSGCDICEGFWANVPDRFPNFARLVVVTRDRTEEQLTKLLKVSPPHLKLVMSSKAWTDYLVPAHPYFVFVRGTTGQVVGEGTGMAWDQVFSMVQDYLTEDQLRAMGAGVPSWHRDRVDEVLSAAGIGPDHPSLYPQQQTADQTDDFTG